MGHPIRKRKVITPTFLMLGVLFLIGAYFIVVRFFQGIGPVSNLNDYYSWGTWKTFGVLIGTGLVCGGYVSALVVYIMNKGHYHRFVRPALLASMLGYMFGGLAVIIDIGRWWNMFNVFMPQYAQFNSLLFEVAVCVLAYTTVLVIEFSPAILERFATSENEGKLKDMAASLTAFLDKILFAVIAMGVLLPTMHQSSLGGMAILFGQKLNPLWQTPFVSMFHLISAIGMGFGSVIFLELVFSENKHKLKFVPLLERLAQFMVYTFAIYMILRVIDIVRRGVFDRAFNSGLASYSFWLEVLLIVTGTVMLSKKKFRRSPRKLFIGSATFLGAGSLYRLNTYIIGFEPDQLGGAYYFPSVPELFINLGMFSLEIMLFIAIVKLFPVLSKRTVKDN